MTNFIKNILKIDIQKNLKEIGLRFPLSSVLILIVSLVLFYMINTETTDPWIPQIIVTGIVTLLLATTLSLIAEREKNNGIRIASYVLPLIFAVFFYFSIEGIYDGDIEPLVYSILSFSGFVASLFVAPFIIRFFQKKKESSIHFSNYFSRVAWVFLISVVVGVALMTLGFIAIGSVMALFDITDLIDESKLFGNWATIALALVAPFYALSLFPVARDYETQSYLENRFFSFMIRYIAVPFIFIYFLILYAYSMKVLMNFSEWPKGMVSWMVIGFSSFGYLVYIFSRPYVEQSRMVSILRTYFPYMVIPQLLMLSYAIGLRIMQYDVTMNRYFVVVFGIWLAIISLYYVFSRARALTVIPLTLALSILVISVGPWSVYSFPMVRQEARLQSNLESAGILQNGNIVPLEKVTDISRTLSTDIASGISYLCDFRECETIIALFPAQYEQADVDAEKEWSAHTYEGKKVYTKPTKYQITAAVKEYIKVQEYWGHEGTEPRYLQFNTNGKELYPLNISDYDTIVDIYGSGAITKGLSTNPDSYILVDVDSSTVTYIRKGEENQVFDLPQRDDLDSNADGSTLDSSDLIFTLTGTSTSIELHFQSYAIKNPNYRTEDKENNYYMVDGIALIRETK